MEEIWKNVVGYEGYYKVSNGFIFKRAETMYRITPSDARTDLYEIGKGAAQVIDLSPLRQQAEAENERNFRADQANKKQEYDREQDVYDKLGKLSVNSDQIRLIDQPIFAKKKEEFYNQTKADISKLRKGDAEAWMKFHKTYGDIISEAEMSKNAREYAEQLFKKPLDQMDEEDVAELQRRYNTPGDYGTDFTLNKKVSWNDIVNKELVPLTRKMANDYNGQGKKLERSEVEGLLDQQLSDPLKARQANRDFKAATDDELKRLKLTREGSTARDYILSKYTNNLIVEDKIAPRAAGGGQGSGSKLLGKVSINKFTNDGDGTESATVSVNGKKPGTFTIIDPKNPGQTYEYQPLKFKRFPNGEMVLLASNKTMGGKVDTLDYSTVQDVLFQGYAIENPTQMMNDPKSVGAGRVKDQTVNTAKKQIKESDISSKAKVAGYTDSEYRKMLKDRGIEIIK